MQAVRTTFPAPAAGPAPRYLTGERICPGLLASERLATGRRCETWVAWSIPLWSQVVVKLPRDELVDDLGSVRHLKREARLLRRLSHPAIQRLLEDAHWHPVPHLVLEYVEGPTLESMLEDEGALPPAEVIRVGMQVGACLHYMHGEGLAHLDVKPSNVVVREGRTVLLDLDIAQKLGQPAPRGRPQGTRPYMAPEQCRRQPVDLRMDLFALGAVLYELATGQRAFVSDESGSGSYPQLETRAARALAIAPSLPRGLDLAIHSLLEPNPESRPQTALEALRLLAAALPVGEDGAWPGFVDSVLANDCQPLRIRWG
jgi:serine/threonine protein kinase